MLSLSFNGQIQKAAIISIYGNKNLSDSPLETKLYEALLKDSSFDISGTVFEFEKTLDEKLIPEFPFPFKEKDEVVSSEGYQNLEPRWDMNEKEDDTELEKFLETLVPAEGYKNIASYGIVTDKKTIKKTFELFPDVDAVMIAYLDYGIYASGGVGPLSKKKVNAYVNIKMYNKDGKRIFKLKESSSSKSGVTAVAGFVTDPEKLKPMIAEASEQLLIDMQKKFPKSMKKLTKKLAKAAKKNK